MRRICFTLQVKPDRLEEYRRRHAQVWPEMLAALRDTGWHDYSLFLREDGLLVGYLLTDDFEGALAAMDATAINARWQAQMSEFFDSGRPDQHMRVLTEVFNLDDQLRDDQLRDEQRRDEQRRDEQRRDEQLGDVR